MKIRLTTPLNRDYKEVYQLFNQELFEFLSPVFPKIQVKRFDGSEKGDFIHLKFGFPLYKKWVSEITEADINSERCYFIDEGRELPPGIVYWKHKHIVKKTGENSCEIIDDIEFKSWNPIFSRIFYPVLYLSFSPRKELYKKFFSSN